MSASWVLCRCLRSTEYFTFSSLVILSQLAGRSGFFLVPLELATDWLRDFFGGLFGGLSNFLKSLIKKVVVGVGFEPTNAEAGGFTVRIL